MTAGAPEQPGFARPEHLLVTCCTCAWGACRAWWSPRLASREQSRSGRWLAALWGALLNRVPSRAPAWPPLQTLPSSSLLTHAIGTTCQASCTGRAGRTTDRRKVGARRRPAPLVAAALAVVPPFVLTVQSFRPDQNAECAHPVHCALPHPTSTRPPLAACASTQQPRAPPTG